VPGGRPSKLTPDVQERICTAVRAGNYYEAACRYGGVSYANFRLWMLKGKQASSGKFHELYEAVLKAEADAEVAVVALWKKQIPDNWQAARDFLARRFPRRWGNKDRHEHEHGGGLTLLVEELVVHADEQANAETNGQAHTAR
jgi:hypothetical protein